MATVGSWPLAVGSWQLTIGSWQLNDKDNGKVEVRQPDQQLGDGDGYTHLLDDHCAPHPLRSTELATSWRKLLSLMGPFSSSKWAVDLICNC